MGTSKRITISLPESIANDLDFIAGKLGISRSAFLSQLLSGANLDHLRSLLSTLPEQDSEGDVKRFRGESRQFVKAQLEQLQELQGGLFDGSGE